MIDALFNYNTKEIIMEKSILSKGAVPKFDGVQSILRQNDKILDLNREIFKFIKEYKKPFTINLDKMSISEKLQAGKIIHPL
jgi:hypothetical protein